MVHPRYRDRGARRAAAAVADAGLSDHRGPVAGGAAQAGRAPRWRSSRSTTRCPTPDCARAATCRTSRESVRSLHRPPPERGRRPRSQSARIPPGGASSSTNCSRSSSSMRMALPRSGARATALPLPANGAADQRAARQRCRSRSRARKSAPWRRDRCATSRSRIRCSACCRATSAAARPSSRRWPPAGGRERLPGGAHGAHRNPRRAAPAQVHATGSSRSACAIAWLARRPEARREKQAVVRRWRAGDTLLAIGTHALFQEDVSFASLGLAIVDEQHRFGVQPAPGAAAERRRRCRTS